MLKTWKRTSAENDRQEVQNLAEVTTKNVVARFTTEAIDRLYDNLKMIEGHNHLYSITASGDKARPVFHLVQERIEPANGDRVPSPRMTSAISETENTQRDEAIEERQVCV